MKEQPKIRPVSKDDVGEPHHVWRAILGQKEKKKNDKQLSGWWADLFLYPFKEKNNLWDT